MALTSVAYAASGDKLDLTGYVQTFDARFNQPNGSQPDPSVWTTAYYFGRFIPGERAAYHDAQSCPNRSPFWIGNGSLQVTAFKPDAWGLTHCLTGTTASLISGLVTTQHTFSQTYGYFEATLYSGAEASGEWPAFWLLPTKQTPANFGQCPEYDVMERWGGSLAYLPGSRWANVYQTLHACPAVPGGPEIITGNSASPPKVAAGWHAYGLLWTTAKLTWYVDRVETYAIAFANSDPHYMIVNLAIDGRYAAPAGPVQLHVSGVRAYALPTSTGAKP